MYEYASKSRRRIIRIIKKSVRTRTVFTSWFIPSWFHVKLLERHAWLQPVIIRIYSYCTVSIITDDPLRNRKRTTTKICSIQFIYSTRTRLRACYPGSYPGSTRVGTHGYTYHWVPTHPMFGDVAGIMYYLWYLPDDNVNEMQKHRMHFVLYSYHKYTHVHFKCTGYPILPTYPESVTRYPGIPTHPWMSRRCRVAGPGTSSRFRPLLVPPYVSVQSAVPVVVLYRYGTVDCTVL